MPLGTLPNDGKVIADERPLGEYEAPSFLGAAFAGNPEFIITWLVVMDSRLSTLVAAGMTRPGGR